MKLLRTHTHTVQTLIQTLNQGSPHVLKLPRKAVSVKIMPMMLRGGKHTE